MSGNRSPRGGSCTQPASFTVRWGEGQPVPRPDRVYHPPKIGFFGAEPAVMMTDREMVIHHLRRAADAVERGDVSAAMHYATQARRAIHWLGWPLPPLR